MGVLNNSEIKAVANKILKKLQQLKEEKRQDLIDNYVPSDLYNELDGYLTQADYLKSEIDQCQKNVQYINKCIDQLISEHELKTKYFYDKQEILQSVIDKEYPVEELPTIEDLKQDLIIANIGESFDVDKYINEQLEKYK